MADITPLRTAAETGLTKLFEATKMKYPTGVSIAREEAFRYFEAVGLPTRRVEAFKYTDLRSAFRDAAHPAEMPSAETAKAASAEARGFAGIEAVRLTFVNGHLIEAESDLTRIPAGITVTPLTQALTDGDARLAQLTPVKQASENAIYQLNTAFLADGALITVAAGVTVETPLHLRFVGTGSEAYSTATRVLVVLEEGAEALILESHEGPDGVAYQPNDAVDVVIGDHATFRHARLNAEGREAVALSTLSARLGAESAIETVNVVVGAVLSRHQVYLNFAGADARAVVNGAAMLNGKQLADTTFLADHAATGGVSRELFKTVVDGAATGVFQGKIIVQQAAQQTDGKMMSACLILSDEGQMMNKPELEIFADDVACGHGATCGALDDDLLFYLMQRGLPKAEAESLLVQAFLGAAIESVGHEGARDALIGTVEAWLKARG
ncbi:Fe-S cluster assembly protein SufD [Methylobacterium sp. Leaf99]|uniref:Fe-S cluster assembly protein SufD n=1 Tax=Methylobacterium sp. Leaf99 TaxID=1736251 RepID=UPI0006F7D6D2|nr:Fe-S cluster assembly protein SufD [Methylobacterium sp. Leaf99]KQP05955.1 Fe-S cluster assembly protein SufD [Methylobacterium sp. Leaf99]